MHEAPRPRVRAPAPPAARSRPLDAGCAVLLLTWLPRPREHATQRVHFDATLCRLREPRSHPRRRADHMFTVSSCPGPSGGPPAAAAAPGLTWPPQAPARPPGSRCPLPSPVRTPARTAGPPHGIRFKTPDVIPPAKTLLPCKERRGRGGHLLCSEPLLSLGRPELKTSGPPCPRICRAGLYFPPPSREGKTEKGRRN